MVAGYSGHLFRKSSGSGKASASDTAGRQRVWQRRSGSSPSAQGLHHRDPAESTTSCFSSLPISEVWTKLCRICFPDGARNLFVDLLAKENLAPRIRYHRRHRSKDGSRGRCRGHQGLRHRRGLVRAQIRHTSRRPSVGPEKVSSRRHSPTTTEIRTTIDRNRAE